MKLFTGRKAVGVSSASEQPVPDESSQSITITLAVPNFRAAAGAFADFSASRAIELLAFTVTIPKPFDVRLGISNTHRLGK